LVKRNEGNSYIAQTLLFFKYLDSYWCSILIVFPLKAPTYFVLKDFKKYDWNVEVNPRKPKKENEYDVIIIGSGIGGLICGALLSKRGYKVLVLEQKLLKHNHLS